MIKTVKLLEIGKRFFSKKFKVMARDGWVYDFEWRMGFKNETYRQQFLNKIKRAQDNIREGKVTPIEEAIKEMNDWMATTN